MKNGENMEMNDYQNKTQATAIYPGQGTQAGLTYAILGMVGEAGEVANRYKKVLRDDAGALSEKARTDLLNECGDTLWYIARICHELGCPLNMVASHNIEKLRDRAARTVLAGSGNSR